MSEQQGKKNTKADNKKSTLDPSLVIAVKIMRELERVHQRIPKF